MAHSKTFNPFVLPDELTPFQKKVRRSTKILRSLKAKADAKRTPAEKLADWMTATFGNISFLTLNVLWFTIWILINTGVLSIVKPFDPFPFGLLTTIVSLEAIILAIFVLISQNREQRVNDLREEIDLQIDVITENELTKLMEIVIKIAEKHGIDFSKDEELMEMLRPLNHIKIEESLEKEIK